MDTLRTYAQAGHLDTEASLSFSPNYTGPQFVCKFNLFNPSKFYRSEVYTVRETQNSTLVLHIVFKRINIESIYQQAIISPIQMLTLCSQALQKSLQIMHNEMRRCNLRKPPRPCSVPFILNMNLPFLTVLQAQRFNFAGFPSRMLNQSKDVHK